jgi:hypothetical protein
MMPYVPSLKTDGKSQDRILIDAAVEKQANFIVENVKQNTDMLNQYKNIFTNVGYMLLNLSAGFPTSSFNSSFDYQLAQTIFDVGDKYNYQGAFLGELNYAITRLIQRVPQLMVESGKWAKKDEIRYWLYAMTVEALIQAADLFKGSGIGIGGVFEDIKDEYKRRVNPSYEAAQIVKSGDCYDTPYYNRLVRIIDEEGKEVGKILVDMVRSEETLHKDVLDGELVLRTKVNSQL